MTRLALTENRLPDASFDRHTNPGSTGYRFGRISGTRPRRHAGRVVRGARGFFSVMLELLAAAKMRRIERELSLRGLHRGSIRWDGDRFSAVDD
jgi:hypothetical protein